MGWGRRAVRTHTSWFKSKRQKRHAQPGVALVFRVLKVAGSFLCGRKVTLPRWSLQQSSWGLPHPQPAIPSPTAFRIAMPPPSRSHSSGGAIPHTEAEEPLNQKSLLWPLTLSPGRCCLYLVFARKSCVAVCTQSSPTSSPAFFFL